MLTPPPICRAVAAALSWAAQGEIAGKIHAKTKMAPSVALFAAKEIILMQIAAFASLAKVSAAVAALAIARRRLQ
jgi:hypothetical protein